MYSIWKKVTEELPAPDTRVKIDGKYVPDPTAHGFTRAIYTGNTSNGLSGFQAEDPKATIGVTDWLEVDMRYEDEEDWEFAKTLVVPDVYRKLAGREAYAHVI